MKNLLLYACWAIMLSAIFNGGMLDGAQQRLFSSSVRSSLQRSKNRYRELAAVAAPAKKEIRSISAQEQRLLNDQLIEAVQEGMLIDRNGVRDLLARGADVNAHDVNGNTALMKGAFYGRAHIVKTLLDAGANVNKENYNRDTPLMWAGASDVVRLLLGRQDISIDAQNKQGETALMFQVDRGSMNSVRQIVEFGADVNIQNKCGLTALMLAAIGGRADAVRFLLVNNADFQLKNDCGETALDLAKDALNKQNLEKQKKDFEVTVNILEDWQAVLELEISKEDEEEQEVIMMDTDSPQETTVESEQLSGKENNDPQLSVKQGSAGMEKVILKQNSVKEFNIDPVDKAPENISHNNDNKRRKVFAEMPH